MTAQLSARKCNRFILEEMKSHDEENIFYHKTDDGTRLEIDFLIQRNGKLLPIEVKAECNVEQSFETKPGTSCNKILNETLH